MRLQEIKKKIEKYCENDKIVIPKGQTSGNYYVILESDSFFSLMQFISKQKWCKVDFSQMDAVINATNALASSEVILDGSQYNIVSSYINKVNEILPMFFNIVSSLNDEQNEFDINIKLSDAIKTVDDLKNITEEIEKLGTYANLDGRKLQFVGFDVGSSWIVICANCTLVYGFIMACTKLAQELLKLGEQYYKTREAKIHYKMTLKKDEEFTEDGLNKYCEKYSEEYEREGAHEIAQQIGEYNGSTESEIEEKAKKTTEALLSIIGNGNEVHISLNDNNIVKESENGTIEMEYDELKKYVKKQKPPKLIGDTDKSSSVAVEHDSSADS